MYNENLRLLHRRFTRKKQLTFETFSVQVVCGGVPYCEVAKTITFQFAKIHVQ